MRLTITKISFGITLIGIFLLICLSNLSEPILSKISDLSIKDLNKRVKIKGEVTKIKSYEHSKDIFYVLEISDKSGKIESVLSTKKNILKKNQSLILIGKISQYKDSMQIQVEKITQIS